VRFSNSGKHDRAKGTRTPVPLVSFHRLIAHATNGDYAVGYFESWNLESLQAVIDAAEMTESPVIVGFSGLNLPDPRREMRERLELFAALGLSACASARVPVALLFNESPDLEWIEHALELGFNLVMYADEHAKASDLMAAVKRTVALAAGRAAVEAEMAALPGVATGLDVVPPVVPLTDPDAAARFVAATGIDALAVSLGNVHLHGRRHVALDIDRLLAIRRRVNVPLVLHGASSIDDMSLRDAINAGIRKINVGSALRRAFYLAVQESCLAEGDEFNPYLVLGSGLSGDVLLAGRLAVRDLVADRMRLFGSAGKSPGFGERA
jgi:ketose-bisphosphate aldolase